MERRTSYRSIALAGAVASAFAVSAPSIALADDHAVDPIPANARALTPFVSGKITGPMIVRADADNDGFIDGKELRTLRRNALDKLLDND